MPWLVLGIAIVIGLILIGRGLFGPDPKRAIRLVIIIILVCIGIGGIFVLARGGGAEEEEALAAEQLHVHNMVMITPLTISNKSNGRLKVVFMDHQKDYNVYVDKIWSLLDRIAENQKIFLIVKQISLTDL